MNIRDGINQLLDEKNVSVKSKEIINQGLDKQDEKGLATYGQTLDDCPDDDYDWNQMALEEVLDALQYKVKENNLLNKQLRKEIRRRKQTERKLNQLSRGEQIEHITKN